MLSSAFENAGYTVFEAQDGFNVICEIKTSSPAIILCSVGLPLIPGFELSRIIKSQEDISRPFFVYSLTEENVSQTIISKSNCDDFYTVESDQLDTLVSKIEEKVIDKKFNETETSEKDNTPSELAAIKNITKFYEKESEDLNIIAAINKVFENLGDLRKACLALLKTLSDFVSYDIVLLSIYNNDKVHEYCNIRSPLSENEIQDFTAVCHNKFLTNCDSNKQINFLNCVYCDSENRNFQNTAATEKIKVIESANIFYKGKEFLGSITIGTAKTTRISNSNSRKFQFYAEKLSPYIKNVITQYKMGITIHNLRKAFSSFVPEEIIDDLIDKANVQTETAGEKRQVAVLICDIRSFTTISERNKAEDVVSFLNAYFTKMVEIIKTHGGSIDKFMGDAIMALFGAPISYEDNAQRAVEAAMEMISKLPTIDYSRLTLPEGINQISIGIGIHYGEVILGSIGCSDKKDYTVIGDSVNLASRLEGLTKLYGYHIVISDSIKSELNDKITAHKLDKVAVKGKKIPVWIYSIDTDLEKKPEEYHKNYNKGMELYEVGAWSLAKGYFEKAIAFTTACKAAELMLARCNNYIENPPENWDGAVVLTSK